MKLTPEQVRKIIGQIENLVKEPCNIVVLVETRIGLNITSSNLEANQVMRICLDGFNAVNDDSITPEAIERFVN